METTLRKMSGVPNTLSIPLSLPFSNFRILFYTDAELTPHMLGLADLQNMGNSRNLKYPNSPQTGAFYLPVLSGAEQPRQL